MFDTIMKLLKSFAYLSFGAYCSLVVILVYYFMFWSMFLDTEPRLVEFPLISKVIIFMFISILMLFTTTAFYNKSKTK